MCTKFPELYFQSLMRLVPREVNTRLQQDTNVNLTYHTIAEVKQALLEEGMTPKEIRQGSSRCCQTLVNHSMKRSMMMRMWDRGVA